MKFALAGLYLQTRKPAGLRKVKTMRIILTDTQEVYGEELDLIAAKLEETGATYLKTTEYKITADIDTYKLLGILNIGEEICYECGRSVKGGSGRFTNRIPSLDDYDVRKDNNVPFPQGKWLCNECDQAAQRGDKNYFSKFTA